MTTETEKDDVLSFYLVTKSVTEDTTNQGIWWMKHKTQTLTCFVSAKYNADKGEIILKKIKCKSDSTRV